MQVRNRVFAYTGSTGTYPSFLSMNEIEGGAIEVVVRGSPRMSDTPGGRRPAPGYTANAVLPRDAVPALIERLLSVLPLTELHQTKPLVLYFGCEADRQEVIDAVMAVKPDMRVVAI